MSKLKSSERGWKGGRSVAAVKRSCCFTFVVPASHKRLAAVTMCGVNGPTLPARSFVSKARLIARLNVTYD